MAHFIRNAKSGSDWTINELNAYNITVVYQDAPTFFNIPTLPHPSSVSPEILTTEDPNDATTEDVYELLSHLDLAMSTSTSSSPAPADDDDDESGVVDFVLLLLRTLGYTGRGRHFRTRKEIPFVICGEKRHANTDVCIITDDQEVLFLVQEDKRHSTSTTTTTTTTIAGDHPAEAQIVAEAIAAFALNNQIRRDISHRHLPVVSGMMMPGMTIKGTMPTFYKVGVTMELVDSVAGGAYPSNHTTTVYAHVPSIPRPGEGMKPLDNRYIILSCFEAFKQFL